jgi:hypothetical protein
MEDKNDKAIVNTGIRSAAKYSENPFLNGTPVTQIAGRKKKYSIASKNNHTITDRAGQVVGGVEHTIVKVVDDTQFVKVFADGIVGIYDLNRPGGKVFRYLFDEVQKNKNIDKIYLYFMDAQEEPWSISKPVFFKGMAELLAKNFIARSSNPNMFYLNPAMIWNGDRFKFVQEYQRESTTKKQLKSAQETPLSLT